MSAMTCEHALPLAGQTKLSGEVLAARWHLHHCPDCQRMLSRLRTQLAVLNDQQALQKLLDVDLTEANCEQNGRVITWLARGTREVLAAIIQLGELTSPLLPAAELTLLGDIAASRSRNIRQETGQALDGSLIWKVTFIVDSSDAELCRAEVEVSQFDRWDLAGVDVFLIWDGNQRRGQTDERGQAHFGDIPIEAWGHIQIVLRPPQRPINTKGPQ